MNEDFKRKVDVITKIITTLALVLGGFWTAITYFVQRKADLENRALETRKPFLQKRLEACIEITNITATIVVNRDQKDVAEAKQKFWMYYSGPIRMVDDSNIRVGMDVFGMCLKEGDKCSDLKASAEDLVVACRKSLGGSWDQIPDFRFSPKRRPAMIK